MKLTMDVIDFDSCKIDPKALAEETRALLAVRDFPLALERVGQAYKLARSGDTSAEADRLLVELLASALTLLGRERWLEK